MAARTTWLFLTMTTLACGWAALACSGSSDDSIGPSPGSSSSSGGGSGGGNDASTSHDATVPGNDASNPGNGNDASNPTNGNDSSTGGGDIPDGGAPVTPGVIQCGGVDCHVDQSTCCAQFDGSADCVSGSSTTCPSGGTLHCLEAADCTGSQVCCGTFQVQSVAPFEATSNTACATGPCPTNNGAQFCRTNAECLNGQPCVPQTCFGVTIEVCGLQSQYGCTAN